MLDRALGLGVMTRARRKLAISHRTQLAAQNLLRDGDAISLEHPLRQIDQSPAHDPMDRRNGAALDHRGERLPMLVGEL